MDLITLALAKKYASAASESPNVSLTIGENGHWYINGEDTGIAAVTEEDTEIIEFFPEG